MGGLPRLEQRGEKRCVALDQPRFAWLAAELAQLVDKVVRLRALGLQSLYKLQTPHEPKALGLNIRRPWRRRFWESKRRIQV